VVFKIINVGSTPASPEYFNMLNYLVDRFPYFKKAATLGSNILWFVYCLFYDFWNFSFSLLDIKRSDAKNKTYTHIMNYNSYQFRLNIFNKLTKKNNFIDSDFI
jgi:hypothetical protein